MGWQGETETRKLGWWSLKSRISSVTCGVMYIISLQCSVYQCFQALVLITFSATKPLDGWGVDPPSLSPQTWLAPPKGCLPRQGKLYSTYPIFHIIQTDLDLVRQNDSQDKQTSKLVICSYQPHKFHEITEVSQSCLHSNCFSHNLTYWCNAGMENCSIIQLL